MADGRAVRYRLQTPASLPDATRPGDAVRFPLKSEGQDFIDAGKTRGRTLGDEEVGQRVTSVCHLGPVAIRLGRKLTWDPVAERLTGGGADEANAWLDRPIRSPRPSCSGGGSAPALPVLAINPCPGGILFAEAG